MPFSLQKDTHLVDGPMVGWLSTSTNNPELSPPSKEIEIIEALLRLQRLGPAQNHGKVLFFSQKWTAKMAPPALLQLGHQVVSIAAIEILQPVILQPQWSKLCLQHLHWRSSCKGPNALSLRLRCFPLASMWAVRIFNVRAFVFKTPDLRYNPHGPPTFWEVVN